MDEPGIAQVSLEQVLDWNPEIIITIDPQFHEAVQEDPVWAGIDAVRDGRVYLAPDLPFGWFDRPPSVNRLMGVHWLLHLLHPDRVQGTLADSVRRFYALFYHIELDEAQLRSLLANSAS